MDDRVLITGGAGFIGSHVCDRLLESGYQVRVLDNLDPQVHGGATEPPAYLSSDVEFLGGDVRDPESVGAALHDVDMVIHLAAAVGVGQSMYEMRRYSEVNTVGTGVLLEALMKHPVRKLVVASSMSIYGEGMYRAPSGMPHHAAERALDRLRRGDWEVRTVDGDPLTPIPTPETKQPRLTSIYALSKYNQERMAILFGGAYGVPVVALRFFNVYGTRQALSNPYTGVLAIFASRYINNRPPLIFEDGNQMRDFVSVEDVSRGVCLALENEAAVQEVFNIGSGESVSVRSIANTMAKVLGRETIDPVVTGRYRMGDIRHCFADIEKARRILGYRPRTSLLDGLGELAEWLENQVADDRAEFAVAQLAERGLTV
ncbi:MAG: SDR family NAD(P)-dependent oxidoreductase [Chitinivibrionales bacterium]|nr:SDR family NAD(P)-dependent oxidoreductase [Chitinivibrionales bacterium]MBD3356669.1 SDR family NAD(P)-dependent oxidoreductase [Chitinivibrionales bacterium]